MYGIDTKMIPRIILFLKIRLTFIEEQHMIIVAKK